MRRRTLLKLTVALSLIPAVAHADWMDDFIASDTWTSLKRFGLALLLFLGGWLVAKVVTYMVYWGLSRTDVDQRIAKKLGLHLVLPIEKEGAKADVLERFVSKIVYYLVMLFVVIAALDFGGLTETAGPIKDFVNTLIQALPLVGKAVLILAVAWLIGSILRRVVSGGLGKLNLDRRFAEMQGKEEEKKEPETKDTAAEAGTFSASAGTIVFWLVLLIGLGGAMEALEIEAVADPLRHAFNTAILLLPALATAALILLVGYVLARVARAVVSNLLRSVGLDKLPGRLNLEGLFRKYGPSEVTGIVLMVFILLHAIIAALQHLGLRSISEPLTSMLDQFWSMLPAILVSALILAIGVVAGRIVRGIAEGLLENVGFDSFLEKWGLTLGREAAPTEDEAGAGGGRPIDRPSRLVGFVVQGGIILVALTQVLANLQLAVWSEMVGTFLDYAFWHGLVAVVIAAAGLAVGNYVRRIIVDGGPNDNSARRWMGGAARAVILVFAFTMAFQQLQVAQSFVLLTFALVFGALCLALALAFGLGGREVAGQILREQYGKRKSGGK